MSPEARVLKFTTQVYLQRHRPHLGLVQQPQSQLLERQAHRQLAQAQVLQRLRPLRQPLAQTEFQLALLLELQALQLLVQSLVQPALIQVHRLLLQRFQPLRGLVRPVLILVHRLLLHLKLIGSINFAIKLKLGLQEKTKAMAMGEKILYT